MKARTITYMGGPALEILVCEKCDEKFIIFRLNKLTEQEVSAILAVAEADHLVTERHYQ